MNILQGKISQIESSQRMSLIGIDVDGDTFSSIILEGQKTDLNYREGDLVNLLFKETEVGIAKNLSGQISFRNRFSAKIKTIEKGLILARVFLDYKSRSIESIISTRSANDMNLKENDPVEWLVKSNEISLMKV